MNNEQFEEFMKRLDKVLDLKFADFEERITNKFEPRFQDIEGKLDWIIGTINEVQNEHLALCFTSENHEKRIAKLELAVRN